MRSGRIVMAALAAGVLTLAGCGDGGSSGSTGSGPGGLSVPKIDKLASLGAGEGTVNVVSWAGYVEDGSTDKAVDWVTGFESETGCQVNNKIAGTSDEMVALMKTGEYDVVSASGDASLRLIYGGDVAPVNTDLISNYKDVFEGLKNQRWNSVDGASYGVPHGRGANLLMYRTDQVQPAPTSWSAVFDPASPFKGKITAYDSPIYIADAALYLMKTKPDLKITNPYALDDTQFQAAVDLLKQQNELIGEYWSDYTKEVQAFKAGNSVLGTTWQVIVNLTKADGAPVEAILPSEGATGWSDTWMISAKAAHPNCAYLWMNHIISPKANAGVAEWFGEAPSNKLSCAQTADKNHCATFHAEDEEYFEQVWYWTTPLAQCLDGRTDVTCKDYSAWTQAWTTIKG
ncbi:spermidine/putrescine ABC transporter substrate-binding protein [Actinoplanes italicus]|uniref:Putative spermidine/putrescine transport system substrate-binding protein n=1 Tax=Actinoplanes italicus TaxID=113567 RepID=A0A2T0JWP3_9ACTN|nr:ABC transporter substrate-binding protein [Actinoplanes italicus]PRX12199.1 putative spermidine/putrescine transport system substrate-binding protein [Actinoplanes italicus]GIE35835.1 spermidine/putrescine ABC transporter substrate-binding protein [Actinoplanes italicus]